jgi:hypothetical protein
MPGGGIREFTTTVSPRALKERNGERLLFALGMMNDVIIEKHRQGVKGHFVDDCDDSALTFIGNDRGVLRGLTESAESYRARLKRAIDDRRRAGNAWAVLSQVLGYLLSTTPAARTVSAQYSASGVATLANWQEYVAGADPERPPRFTRDNTGNWDWDSASPTIGSWGWWRWYLVLEGGGALADTDWLIGDADAPDIGNVETWCIGFGCSWKVPASLRIIVRQWGSSWCHWMIVTFDDSLFISTGTAGAENPDGLYGHGWKVVAGHHVASRNENARYCIGDF